jgi:hypothetical protein
MPGTAGQALSSGLIASWVRSASLVVRGNSWSAICWACSQVGTGSPACQPRRDQGGVRLKVSIRSPTGGACPARPGCWSGNSILDQFCCRL